MTVNQILGLASELARFLKQFDDCFGRPEPRQHLHHYIRGQLSDLPRKSVEPIALFNEVVPRTKGEAKRKVEQEAADKARAEEEARFKVAAANEQQRTNRHGPGRRSASHPATVTPCPFFQIVAPAWRRPFVPQVAASP